MVAGKPLALGGWWLDSHNCHTIVFCAAWVNGGWKAVVAGQPQFLHNCVLQSLGNGGWKAMGFGWMVAGQPQFLHNCVLHSMGEWWLESHGLWVDGVAEKWLDSQLAGQPHLLHNGSWFDIMVAASPRKPGTQ